MPRRLFFIEMFIAFLHIFAIYRFVV